MEIKVAIPDFEYEDAIDNFIADISSDLCRQVTDSDCVEVNKQVCLSELGHRNFVDVVITDSNGTQLLFENKLVKSTNRRTETYSGITQTLCQQKAWYAKHGESRMDCWSFFCSNHLDRGIKELIRYFQLPMGFVYLNKSRNVVEIYKP
jgi:hypothetical protein